MFISVGRIAILKFSEGSNRFYTKATPKKIPCSRVQGINYFAWLGQAPTLQS